ncbi:MAG: imidazole glycerol phosphate synthase subunit HisH [Planctomycetota bacterium]|nr:imidazole glycerol phosphate synthase subunit HisH [Planctomycetota bacterium]
MIAIIDYRMGNLRSVQKAVERVGGEVHIVDNPRELAQADKLILPGVGAFGDAIRELKQRDLVGPLREAILAGKPFLGICLGLQLLFDVSYEGGEHEGLGILAGRVVRFSSEQEGGRPLKVPHMGWNETRFVSETPLSLPPESGTHFYYVHSYYVEPVQPEIVAAEADYGLTFCSMIQKNNLFATQFHPEKSQAAGLQMLSRFVQMPTASASP